MIDHIRSQLVRQGPDGDHVLVVAFTVGDDVLAAADGRRRVSAHAAQMAGRAFDDALASPAFPDTREGR